MKSDNSKNKTSNKNQRPTLIISLVLVLLLVIVFVVDLVLFYKNVDLNSIFKIFEIVLSSGAAISFSVSLSITVNNNISKKKNVAKGNGLAINESSNVDLKDVNLFSGDKQNIQVTYIGTGIQEFLTVYNEVLLPHQTANIESIAKKTYEELSKQPSDKEINKDFVIKYIEDSKNISDKDIQDIWVKLLLLETRAAEGVSKRTLDIIKNMTSKEAKTFEKIASLSTENNIIPKDFDDSMLDWNSVSLLQDIGLVKSGDLTVNTITFSGRNQLYCNNANIVIVLSELKGNKTTFETPCFVLTSEGVQLKDALSIHMSDSDIINLGNKLKKRNHNKDIEIKAHRITSIEGPTINFDLNDLLI